MNSETFKNYLLSRNFVPGGENRLCKTYHKDNVPVDCTIDFNGEKITKTLTNSVTGKREVQKFNASDVSIEANGKYKITKKPNTRALRNQAMRDLGLTMVRGPVSGKIYWE